MNYFELFEIPVSLNVDRTSLAKRYFELQKKYHPDFHTQASNEEQSEVLETSSATNKAFRIFQNEDATIKYVLQLKGLLQEEEKFNLPTDFLGEMMEINEQLIEAKMKEDAEELKNIQLSIDNCQSSIYAPVKEIIENYKDGITTEKELLQVKEYYFKKKYLLRVLEQLNGMP